MNSTLLEKAFGFAMRGHADQKRKGSKQKVPYLSHVLGAAGIALELGGDEVCVAATFLHDVVEDVKGITIDDIRREFGDEVADVVNDLTENKKLSWEDRKTYAREHIPALSDRSFIAKCSDVLHNTHGIVVDFSIMDWSYFKRGVATTLENYSLILMALSKEAETNRKHLGPILQHRLRRTASKIRTLWEVVDALEDKEESSKPSEHKMFTADFISKDKISVQAFLEHYELHIEQDEKNPSVNRFIPLNGGPGLTFITGQVLCPIELQVYGYIYPRNRSAQMAALANIHGSNTLVMVFDKLPEDDVWELILNQEDAESVARACSMLTHSWSLADTSEDSDFQAENVRVFCVPKTTYTAELIAMLYTNALLTEA